MCFSAAASFGASALLGVAGTAAMSKTKTVPQRLLAGIPFLFSVQQLSEGVLWLSLKNPSLAHMESFLTYTFLVFAMMLWPLWIPLTIRLLEKDDRRKKILTFMLAIGIIVAAGVAFVFLKYPVKVIATHHHLHYNFGFSESDKLILGPFSFLYVLATIVAPFISSIKPMKWLGIIFAISYAAAILFFAGFVVSVWCYFAAVLSLIVIWIILQINKPLANDLILSPENKKLERL